MTEPVSQSAPRSKKRKSRKRRVDVARYKVSVSASALRISRMGPRLSRLDPEGECRSTITIEGQLDKPVLRAQATHIYVFEGDGGGGNPGGAIGATSHWQVALYLPREQFNDLRAMVLSERLATVDLLVEGLSRGKGAIRSVDFETIPVPVDRDSDGEQEL